MVAYYEHSIFAYFPILKITFEFNVIFINSKANTTVAKTVFTKLGELFEESCLVFYDKAYIYIFIQWDVYLND